MPKSQNKGESLHFKEMDLNLVLIGVAISVNGVPIRLTDERWEHIVIGHPELKELFTEVINTIREPLSVRLGNNDELLAIQELEAGKYIVVVYREINTKDGFVITAFITKKIKQMQRRLQLWPK